MRFTSKRVSSLTKKVIISARSLNMPTMKTQAGGETVTANGSSSKEGVGNLSLSRPTGQYDFAPKLASAILLFGLTSVGFPLSLVYVAEDLILETELYEAPLRGSAWLGVTALTVVAVIKLYLYLCHGGKGFEPGIDILPSTLFATVFVTGFLIVFSFALTVK
jgi:hypothetical protein